MANYKIDKEFLKRSKELKIEIDDEWYNGELKVYTVAAINKEGVLDPAEFGTVEELYGILKDIPEGGDIDVLINPDDSARASNGV